MIRHKVTPLVFLLIGSGLAILAYHLYVLGLPLVPNYSSGSWLVEAKIAVKSINEKTNLSLFLPQVSKNHRLENEQFISDGFALATISEAGSRVAHWSRAKSTGDYNIYYRALVRAKTVEESAGKSKKKKPSVAKTFKKEKKLKLARKVNKRAWRETGALRKFVERLSAISLGEKKDNNFLKLMGGQNSRRQRLELVCKLLAVEKIPARLAHGILLEKAERNINLKHWLEIYSKGEWLSFEPASKTWEIPSNQFLWWRGNHPQVESSNPAATKTTLSISPGESAGVTAAINRSKDKKQAISFFSISSLPVQTQAVYRQMLLIPLGALLVAVLRNVIGLKTFGTFMPVLIALSFRDTKLLWGAGLFTTIVALGLLARIYFEKLKLLAVPRLTATLTLVIIAILFLALLAEHFGIDPALSIALFPLVIITMTIERMSVVWEETGGREALLQGLGSLAVATVTYFIVTNRYLEYLFFVFPELLLIVMGLAIALGRYKGYRLFELFRFKDAVAS